VSGWLITVRLSCSERDNVCSVVAMDVSASGAALSKLTIGTEVSWSLVTGARVGEPLSTVNGGEVTADGMRVGCLAS